MTGNRNRLLFLTVVILLLSGCASAKLEVESAIYAREPYESLNLDQAELFQQFIGIDRVQTAAAEIAEARLRLADRVDEVVSAYARLVDPTPTGELSAPTRGVLIKRPEYNAAIDQGLAAINETAQEARTALSEFADVLALGRPEDEIRLQSLSVLRDRYFALIRLLTSKLRDFGLDLGTQYEKDVAEYLDKAPGVLSQANLEALSSVEVSGTVLRQAQELGRAFESLAEELENLNRESFAVSSALANDARSAGEAFEKENGGFAESARQAANLLADVSLKPGVGREGQETISILTTQLDLYLSQIDRLQDPADPVWREITDPKNEEFWAGTYARTFYYAEGNTGVVVVRDRVGQFRVHQAKNDPTALVQGQLRISRTIASALTDVLAASFGVAGLSGLLPGGKAVAAPESGEPPKPESDAENDQIVRNSLRRREAAQTNLIRGLDRIGAQLEGMTDSDPGLGAVIRQLQATLNGNKPVFAANGD